MCGGSPIWSGGDPSGLYLAFEGTWAHLTRCKEPVGGEVLSSTWMMRILLSILRQLRVRGRDNLFVFSNAVYEAHMSCFYWTDELGVCRASTNGLKVVYVPLILKVRQERDLKKWHQDGF